MQGIAESSKTQPGTIFGRLTVLKTAGRKRYCRCVCGNEVLIEGYNLLNGVTKSCGCLWTEAVTKHSMSYTKLYNVWKQMVQRCNNPNNPSYVNYGGRGIKVCEDWLNPQAFLTWAIPLWEEGKDLDRIDNDKGYSPENCRFASKELSAINKRLSSRSKTGYIGVTKCKSYSKIRAEVSRKYIGSYVTIKEAVEARNKYILDNNLPHAIQQYVEK